VDESDAHAMRTGPRSIVNHPQTLLLHFGNPGLDPVHGVGDVVEAFASLFQEGRHRAGRVGRLQQFQPHVTDAEKSDPNLLTRNVLDPFENRAEDALIERLVGVYGADCDANVVNGFNGGHRLLLGDGSAMLAVIFVPVGRAKQLGYRKIGYARASP
jgi:hypothetical protein